MAVPERLERTGVSFYCKVPHGPDDRDEGKEKTRSRRGGGARACKEETAKRSHNRENSLDFLRTTKARFSVGFRCHTKNDRIV